tara:strand:- start:12798 stop:13418 length:621 start_codon:yes stop_codon:yes gene_type:complete
MKLFNVQLTSDNIDWAQFDLGARLADSCNCCPWRGRMTFIKESELERIRQSPKQLYGRETAEIVKRWAHTPEDGYDVLEHDGERYIQITSVGAQALLEISPEPSHAHPDEEFYPERTLSVYWFCCDPETNADDWAGEPYGGFDSHWINKYAKPVRVNRFTILKAMNDLFASHTKSDPVYRICTERCDGDDWDCVFQVLEHGTVIYG